MSWPQEPLGAFIAERLGSVDPSRFPNEEFQLFSIPAFDQGQPERLTGSEIGSAKQVVQTGDVLFSRIVPHIRRAWVVGPTDGTRQIGSGEWIVFRSPSLDAVYLRYFLLTDDFYSQIAKTLAGVGGSLMRARPSEVAKIRIPLPPLQEQKRIAAILDKAEAVRRKREGAIQLADEFLRSLFLDMFGDPVRNLKGWPIVPASAVTTCIVPGRDKPKTFSGSIPWVTTEDLKVLGYTGESGKNLALTQEEIQQVNAKKVPRHSVLMTCVGELGISSLAERELVMNQQLHSFQCSPVIDPPYLMYVIPFQRSYLTRIATSTTIPYLNKASCNSLPVPLPGIDLQREFGAHFRRINKLKSGLLELSREAECLCDSLSKAAFCGGV